MSRFIIFHNWPEPGVFKKYLKKRSYRKSKRNKVTKEELEEHINLFGDLPVSDQAELLGVSTAWYYVLRRNYGVIKKGGTDV